MASQADVERICLSLPGVVRDTGRFRFLVTGKGVCWVWLERHAAGRRREPNPEVLAVWVGTEMEKHALIDMDPHVFFTETHYDGYPGVLVRLPVVDLELLETLLTDAWRMRAPKRLSRGS